ncbi:MAG: hypothetical protein AAF984_08635 [Verrucomicrobiota bacterium]
MNESENIQIIFSPVSSAEISALPKDLQLEILAEFNVIQPNFVEKNSDKFGVMKSEARTLFRYRTREYRIYFEQRDEGLYIQRVIHKNTLKDFLFRSNVQLAEDEELQKNPNFWKMIDHPESGNPKN